jgi:uncharacterized cupredoxin-like copper-binding protein
MRLLLRGIALTALMLVVAACGDDGGGEGVEDGVRRIEITAAEFQFRPDLVTVSPGETVEFVVTNDGAEVHEFRVTNQADIDAHVEGGHEEHGGMGDMSDVGDMSDDDMGLEVPTIPVGQTMTLTVTFPDDPTELTRFVCLIPGHYEAGMVGDIIYSP